MKLSSILALGIGAALIAGCSTANKLIGTWEAELDFAGAKGTALQVLNPDGTFSTVNTVQIMGQDVKSTTTGSWESASEDSLTLTVKDVKIEGIPAEAQSRVKQMVETQKDKPQTLTLKWNGKDEFSASGGPQTGGAIVFKRKK